MLPEGYDGCFELMETVTNHLIARYPLLFTVLKDGNYEKGKTGDGKIIRNEITKEILDMTLPLKESPLVYVSKLAKEDFYVVKKTQLIDYIILLVLLFPSLVDLLVLIKNWSSYRYYTC